MSNDELAVDDKGNLLLCPAFIVAPGIYSEYRQTKEHLIAIELVEKGYIPQAIDDEKARIIHKAIYQDFKKGIQSQDVLARNRANIYNVQTFLDYFWFLKLNGRDNELIPEVVTLFKSIEVSCE